MFPPKLCPRSSFALLAPRMASTATPALGTLLVSPVVRGFGFPTGRGLCGGVTDHLGAGNTPAPNPMHDALRGFGWVGDEGKTYDARMTIPSTGDGERNMG